MPEVHTSCIVCCVPRSGSWLLADYLEQTRLSGEVNEYFRPDHAKWHRAWNLPLDAPYDQFIEAAVRHTSTANGVFGVKLHWYQFEWFVDKLRDLPEGGAETSDADLIAQHLPGPHYVHLYREDSARQAVSWYRATYSDHWFDRPGVGPRWMYRPLPAPEVPDWRHVRFLESALEAHEAAWANFYESSGISQLEVRYEDMVVSPADTVAEILEFIGVAVPPDLPAPETRLRKMADDESERMVEAYLEVRDEVEPLHFDVQPERDKVQPRPLPERDSAEQRP